jgi:hypothetical protein
MTPPEPDFESAAEERLDSHLELVRSDPPAPGRSLTRRVFRTLRWQRVLMVPLRAVSAVAQGVLAGVRALLTGRRSSP